VDAPASTRTNKDQLSAAPLAHPGSPPLLLGQPLPRRRAIRSRPPRHHPQTAIIRRLPESPRFASQQFPPRTVSLCAPLPTPRRAHAHARKEGGPLGEGEDAKKKEERGHRPGACGCRRRGSGSAPGDRGEGGGADRARHWARAGKRHARAVLTRSAPLPAAAAGVVLLRLWAGSCLSVCDSPASSAPWRPATATARRPMASATAR